MWTFLTLNVAQKSAFLGPSVQPISQLLGVVIFNLYLIFRYLHDLIMPADEYSPLKELILDSNLEVRFFLPFIFCI